MLNTSIEQSKRLLELGLDPRTADMYYQKVLPKSDKIEHNPKVGNPVAALEWYNKGYTHFGESPLTLEEFCVPAWSLSALLEVMPMNINDYDLYITKHKYVDGGYAYNIEYNRGFTISVLHKETNRNVITAAFEMVKWLLEQKILTFSGNEKDCS